MSNLGTELRKIHDRYFENCLFNFSAKQWAINLRRQDLLNKSPEYLHKNCRVCSEHFEAVMFLNDLRNRLQPAAVPTVVNVPNPPKQITCSRPAPKRRILDAMGNMSATVKKVKHTVPNDTGIAITDLG
jgi:hypothetical protein